MQCIQKILIDKPHIVLPVAHVDICRIVSNAGQYVGAVWDSVTDVGIYRIMSDIRQNVGTVNGFVIDMSKMQ